MYACVYRSCIMQGLALALVLLIHWGSQTHVVQGQRGHFKTPSLCLFFTVALAMQHAIFTFAIWQHLPYQCPSHLFLSLLLLWKAQTKIMSLLLSAQNATMSTPVVPGRGPPFCLIQPVWFIFPKLTYTSHSSQMPFLLFYRFGLNKLRFDRESKSPEHRSNHFTQRMIAMPTPSNLNSACFFLLHLRY